MMNVMLDRPLLAWHFGGDACGFNDGRPIKVGERQRFLPANGHTGIYVCESGMHASEDILDALWWSRGTIIRRVKLSGGAIISDDKVCAEYRTVIWAVPGEELLRIFACKCALSVLHLWSPPPVVVRYLHTQDDTLRYEASAIASAIASAAADEARAARAARAAFAAARAAARRAAARAAAAAAARAADAADGIRDAMRDRQRHLLLEMIGAKRRRGEEK